MRRGALGKGGGAKPNGFGNSAGEIAIDLVEHGARPSLAVRGPVNIIPRVPLGVPFLAFAIALQRLPPKVADALNAPLLRVIVGDLAELGLERAGEGPVPQTRKRGRIPLIDVGTVKLIREGRIDVRPGVDRFTKEGVVFADGTEHPFDAVILATDYRPAVEFLEEPAALDAAGTPRSSGSEALPGLYFCGFYVSPTGMLREIALEAKRIARDIMQKRGSLS